MSREVERVSQPSGELESRGKQAVGREGTRPGWVFQPDVDIVEQEEEFLVTADLPGVDESHVQVRLEEGVLSIEADLAVSPDPSWRPLYTEYRFGSYRREFQISDRIASDEIRATMRDGVLELRLPKEERARPRTIQVRAG
jgi:HSP20 family protein